MLYFKTSIVVAATLLFSIANSQAVYSIDPNSVPISQRNSWCTSQITSCPLLCLQTQTTSTTSANTCDAATLTFNCVCQNGLSPNASEYSQTLPFFMCQEYGNQCVASCGGNTACQSACREDHPCGAQNPTRVNTTSTASTASATDATKTSSQVYTGLGGSSASATSTSDKSGSLAALDIGRSYGLALVFAGVFAGFAWVM